MARAIGSVTVDGFKTDQAEISKVNEEKLRETVRHLIVLLKSYPGSTVKVIGHTDAAGKESYNMELGEKRANATSTALITMGVPADSIEIASKGETELLIKTVKAEPRNRRVEVRFEPFVPQIGSLLPELRLTPPKPAADLQYHPPSPPQPFPTPKEKAPESKPAPKDKPSTPVSVVPQPIPQPLAHPDKDKQVKFKVKVEATLKQEKKEGKPAETHPSAKIILELTIESGSLVELKGKKFEVSFGKVEASIALGLGVEGGKKVAIKPTTPLGVSFTIVEIKSHTKLPVIPVGSTFELKIAFEVDPVKNEMEVQGIAEILIPGEKADFFLRFWGGAVTKGEDTGVETGTAVGISVGVKF
jgi:hypothetical protein